MKRWLILSLILMVPRAEGMIPLPQTKVFLKTEVNVKSSRAGTRKNEYSGPGVHTATQRDTAQKTFLSIQVQNAGPKLIKDIKISYQFYELQFEHSTGTRMVFTRRIGATEKLVPSTSGELTIAELKSLEKKVVETEPLETSYRSTRELTKFIPQTQTAGRKYGGYIVEYYVGGELVKRDASSRRLHEAYLEAIRKREGPTPLRMQVGR